MDSETPSGKAERPVISAVGASGRPRVLPQYDMADVPTPDTYPMLNHPHPRSFPLTAVMQGARTEEMISDMRRELIDFRNESRRRQQAPGGFTIALAVWVGMCLAMATLAAVVVVGSWIVKSVEEKPDLTPTRPTSSHGVGA